MAREVDRSHIRDQQRANQTMRSQNIQKGRQGANTGQQGSASQFGKILQENIAPTSPQVRQQAQSHPEGSRFDQKMKETEKESESSSRSEDGEGKVKEGSKQGSHEKVQARQDKGSREDSGSSKDDRGGSSDQKSSTQHAKDAEQKVVAKHEGSGGSSGGQGQGDGKSGQGGGKDSGKGSGDSSSGFSKQQKSAGKSGEMAAGAHGDIAAMNQMGKMMSTAATSVPTTIPPKVLDQIVQYVRLMVKPGGKKEMQLGLHEAVFKGLRLKISVNNGKVSATFIADSKAVQNLFQSQKSALTQALEEKGLAVETIDVMMT